jgi:hypothetical protein
LLSHVFPSVQPAPFLTAERYNDNEPVTIGIGGEITIQDPAHLIADELVPWFRGGPRLGYRQAS